MFEYATQCKLNSAHSVSVDWTIRRQVQKYSVLLSYIAPKLLTETFEPWHDISNNVVCATSKVSDQPAHTRSLIRAVSSCLNILRVLSY